MIKSYGRGHSMKCLTLRLSDELFTELDKKAHNIGLTKTDYLRQLIENDTESDKYSLVLEKLDKLQELIEKK